MSRTPSTDNCKIAAGIESINASMSNVKVGKPADRKSKGCFVKDYFEAKYNSYGDRERGVAYGQAVAQVPRR